MCTVPTFFSWRTGATLALGLLATAAQAHPGHDSSGFMAALAHPFAGWDHLLAMLAVGVWSAAVLPAGRRLAGPTVFLLLLAVGLLLARAGVALPGIGDGIEQGVALSVALLGLMLAAGRRLAAMPGLIVVGAAALLHGAAHGVELQGGTTLAVTAAGVLLGSALLHGLGLLAGQGLQRLPGWVSRLVATALGGVGLAMLATRL